MKTASLFYNTDSIVLCGIGFCAFYPSTVRDEILFQPTSKTLGTGKLSHRFFWDPIEISDQLARILDGKKIDNSFVKNEEIIKIHAEWTAQAKERIAQRK